MLKADWRPWKETLGRGAFRAMLLGIGAWIFTGAPFWQAIIGGTVGGLILEGFSSRREFRRLRRAEQRRQAAATGFWPIPLASPQPVPDPAALPLPATISYRPGLLSYLLMPVVIWVVVMFWLFWWFWSYVSPFLHLLLLSAMIAVPLSLVVLLFLFQWIEVSDESLTIRMLFWRRSIRWSEARLFAIDAAAKTTDEPRDYELSSATTILRWSRKHTSSRLTWYSGSFRVHPQQMDDLLSLITARTSLPLYDLRDWDWQVIQAQQGLLSPQS